MRSESECVKQCVFDLVELRRGEFGHAVTKFVLWERLDLIAVDNAIRGHPVSASQMDFTTSHLPPT